MDFRGVTRSSKIVLRCDTVLTRIVANLITSNDESSSETNDYFAPPFGNIVGGSAAKMAS